MSVTVTITVRTENLGLARILALEPGEEASTVTVVPTGGTVIHLLWVTLPDGTIPGERFRDNDAVERVEELTTAGDRHLLSLEWNHEDDDFFRILADHEVQVVDASGDHRRWQFELLFPAREQVSVFREACRAASIPIDIRRATAVPEPAENGYGLTDRQRETLVLAVERGYYDVPRACSTADLAAELGVSDQAVTERLRRGIDTLVEQTLLVDDRE